MQFAPVTASDPLPEASLAQLCALATALRGSGHHETALALDHEGQGTLARRGAAVPASPHNSNA